MTPSEYEQIKFGGGIEVPRDIAICPECSSSIYLYCWEWDSETGEPNADGFQIECPGEAFYEDESEEKYTHRWWQSDWQPVVDKLSKWTRQPESERGSMKINDSISQHRINLKVSTKQFEQSMQRLAKKLKIGRLASEAFVKKLRAVGLLYKSMASSKSKNWKSRKRIIRDRRHRRNYSRKWR